MNSEQKCHDIDIEKTLAILRPGGLLSQLLKGFESREQQQQMLCDIVNAYHNDIISLIEAGTGIGKSIAYLIPAILWALQNKERTLISTNTITLQEQLLHKDIPLAAKALDVKVKAVLVKGMTNYVCLRKLEEAKQETKLLSGREAEQLEKIENWAEITVDGTLSELPFVPTRQIWERVCAEGDTCNKRRCPFFKQCHFFEARKQAEDAQILVANHSMLFADLTYRKNADDEQAVGLLPPYTRVILDEAHNVEDVATEFLSDKVSYLQLLRVMGRLGNDSQGKLSLLSKKLNRLHHKNHTKTISSIQTSLNIDLPGMQCDFLQQIHDTFHAFTRFLQSVLNIDHLPETEIKFRILPEHLLHPVWKNEIQVLAKELICTCKRYVQTIHQQDSQISNLQNEKIVKQTESIRHDMLALANRLTETCTHLENFISEEHPDTKVRWIEAKQLRTIANIQLIDAELNISEVLADVLFSQFRTSILCSATITTNQTFQFIRERLGIQPNLLPEKNITESIYLSPFDYQRQALLVVPHDMPTQKHPDYTEAICEKIWQSVVASRGNAFVLFTSYSMLRQCYNQLANRLETHRFPALKQGDDSRKALLEKFKTTNYSVLFGTDSFWQGVDVVGEALRCVIIAKLPFKVPTEPITQARAEAIAANGGNPFYDYSIPNAIVKFKQGFGRLIRNKKDRGCIVCLDSRVITKGYGTLFLNSLPPCRQMIIDSSQMQKQMQDFYRKTYKGQ